MLALAGSGDEANANQHRAADLGTETMAEATSQGHEGVEDKEGEATERPVDVDNVVQPQTEVEALELGALGLHLGWFKNNPQLAGLPSGMRLESEMGNQGLRRWVLILPQDMADLKMTDLSSWLVQAGLGDAYEVHWHGDSWRKEPFRETAPELGQEGMGEPIALSDSELEGLGRRTPQRRGAIRRCGQQVKVVQWMRSGATPKASVLKPGRIRMKTQELQPMAVQTTSQNQPLQTRFRKQNPQTWILRSAPTHGMT